jgi:hypothetical protein
LFYGVILGIFLVAFWFKKTGGNATFFAALITECCVIIIYKADVISFLWLNLIGAVMVIIISNLLQTFFKHKVQANGKSLLNK